MESTNIARVIVLLIICFGLFALGIVFYTESKSFVRQQIGKVKKGLRHFCNSVSLSIFLFYYILSNYNSRLTEVVFKVFIKFYEKHYDAIEDIEWPESFFPKGKTDVVNMYKWIKKHRVDNFIELNSLEFDPKKDHFVYWGSFYNKLKFKLSDGGILTILPFVDNTITNNQLEFSKQYIKIENHLYDLDTQRCLWILERRRFFNI
jgi:hypothetical protein